MADGSTTLPREVSARFELLEASAWKQIQRSVSAEFRARFGVSVRADSGTVRVHALHTAELAMNRVYALGIATPVVPARLDALVHEFILAGSPRFLVSWAPIALPIEARSWLQERAFRRITGIARLARRTAPDLAPASDLHVVEARPEDAGLFGAIAALGNGLSPEYAPGFVSTMGHPGWRHYFAVDGARPVAAAALFVDGDVAWAGLAGTLPADRRRGAQSILLARRVRDAFASGARWITCETTAALPDRPNQSLRNMKRLGFDVTYELENYVLDLRPL